jgi:hypothetical protein
MHGVFEMTMQKILKYSLKVHFGMVNLEIIFLKQI